MTHLSDDEKCELLSLARQSIVEVVYGKHAPVVDLQEKSFVLREPGAAFVTITKGGQLRGCIGTLEAYQPLVMDVIEHAVAAAVHDFRFLPVQPDELPCLELEISVLSKPEKIVYADADDLRRIIRPGQDGVVIAEGGRRATFLPQVWEQLPEFDLFMGHLCRKMGASSHYWKQSHLDVYTYQVEEFKEQSKPTAHPG